MKISQRIIRILTAMDELANTLFNGYPRETISSRAAKAQLRGALWGCILCKFLDTLDKDHCKKNIELNEGKSV